MVIVSVIVIVSLGILRRGVYISSLAWAGLTLLILIKGQCEGLTVGISAEELTPTSFLVSSSKQIINAEFGSFRRQFIRTSK